MSFKARMSSTGNNDQIIQLAQDRNNRELNRWEKGHRLVQAKQPLTEPWDPAVLEYKLINLDLKLEAMGG
jgi:hypothetical protein